MNPSMAKDNNSSSAARSISRTQSLTNHSDDLENEPENVRIHPPYPPCPRSPLNSIPDPSQLYRHHHSRESFPLSQDLDNLYQHQLNFGKGNATPRISSSRGGGKAHSEPNSTQTTPSKGAAPRISNIGTRGGGFSRAYREISGAEQVVQVPHFELVENQLFWNDRNVQVLIRIRPLTNIEKVSQEYWRCLRQESAQTVTWLGQPETRFTFDHVASETTSQEELFKAAGVPIVENCMSGYNSCIFAYGQTGSGKTYTMMGEIRQMHGKLHEDCGITPRIFEYLFKRIREEEDSRRAERLKYSCKCSFLEIYNEQITDLLEPSSTNLQLREDLKKGVYVENLSEHSAETADDILSLLVQGAATRKMAATKMNSESSRSHSVFTCIIKSRWEKDSMTHLRFGRLNLVDLAGSERQKSSGAEGDRLKEAANINKSLSTLGLVIMSLVDLAHGKQRHIPYRDSRLTFLLQDSLGGNSKTTIIANVSPSICSANETLSTLKFAQRAKLIQNNAKVNEDASGDVTALQRQIQHLKGQLSFLLNQHKGEESFCHDPLNLDRANFGGVSERSNHFEARNVDDICRRISCTCGEMMCLKETLLGALRREKLSDLEVKRLKAEIKQMNNIVNHLQEDAQHDKMLIRSRDEKIRRLELLTNGLTSMDKFLLDENNALKQEMLLLEAKVEKNPKLGQMLQENDRLIEQLRCFQDFYAQEEREILLAEISQIRDQFLKLLEVGESSEHPSASRCETHQDFEFAKELEEQRATNSKLVREAGKFQKELTEHYWSQTALNSLKGTIDRSDSGYQSQRTSLSLSEDGLMCCDGGQHVNLSTMSKDDGNKDCQKMSDYLEKGHNMLDYQYSEDNIPELPCHDQNELVQQEVEMKTTKTILNLQEEINLLSELQGRLHSMEEENAKLRHCLLAKEDEIKALSADWERATLELTSFLTEGSKSLRDASSQIENITFLFPSVNSWISEHVEKTAKMCIEKENTILLLERNLEEAQKTIFELDEKLSSLRGAVIAITGVQQLEDEASNLERIPLSNLFNGEANMQGCLEQDVTSKEGWEPTAEISVKSTSFDLNRSGQPVKSLSADETNDTHWVDTDTGYRLAHFALLEVENAVTASSLFVESQFSSLQSDMQEAFSLHKELISDFAKGIRDVRSDIAILKNNFTDARICTDGKQSIYADKFLRRKNEEQILHQAKDELIKIEGIWNTRGTHFDGTEHTNSAAGSSSAAEEWSSDSSSSCSISSSESILKEKRSYRIMPTDQILRHECQGSSVLVPCAEEPQRQVKVSNLEGNVFCLQKDIRAACDAFVKLNGLTTVELCSKDNSDGCESNSLIFHSVESLKGNMNNSTEGGRDESKLIKVRNEVESDCHVSAEISSVGKLTSADSFFTKFEEACATMKEADYMLNALLNANESAKQYNDLWKQAGIRLKAEKANLLEEIKQLKSSMKMRDNESEIFQEKLYFSITETVKLMLSIKSSLQQNVEDLCKKIYSDAITIVKDTLKGISSLRSLLVDISSMMNENGILSFIIHDCHVTELIRELRDFRIQCALGASSIEEASVAFNDSWKSILHLEKETVSSALKGNKKGYEARMLSQLEGGATVHDEVLSENVELKKELDRKEAVLQGLLFDFSLLQESVSSRKDAEDELARLKIILSQVQQELDMKSKQLDKLVIHHKKLEDRLTETEDALFHSNRDLEEVRDTMEMMTEQNAELRMVLKDTYLQKSALEHELEEQRENIKDLESEILKMSSLSKKVLVSSRKSANGDVQRIIQEKDELLDKLESLQEKLDIAQALSDEKEAIAQEALQESEASKVYAEQKEEEVKILEHSVEELERTINVLERKVCEMEAEVEQHRSDGDILEVELKELRNRLFIVESITSMDCKNLTGESFQNQISRKLLEGSLEYHEAPNQIKRLEEEKEKLAKEVKQYKEYVTELLVHADAQAVQYQQKYNNLEAMVREVRTESSNIMSGASTLDSIEQGLPKTRGSSPFRCISNLVQQMNIEKDKELSSANQRIDELESLVACRQKQVCLLNTRLAAVESMTHDVIRDLLGVKLDMTNYADLVSQNQLQKLVEAAQEQTQEFTHMEKEVVNLRKQITELMQEKDRCILEVKRKEADELARQMKLEYLRERDHLLATENEMLKTDRYKLQRKVVEQDEIITTLIGPRNFEPQT